MTKLTESLNVEPPRGNVIDARERFDHRRRQMESRRDYYRRQGELVGQWLRDVIEAADREYRAREEKQP